MRLINATIETRRGRNRLSARHEPHYRMIEPGLALGYRKPLDGGAGTWLARWRAGKRYKVEVLRGRDGKVIVADDHTDADNVAVLNFAQAQAAARAAAKTAGLGEHTPDALVTVKQALDDYEANLKRRGASTETADRARHHLPAELAKLIVAKLRVRDFDSWNAALDKAELTAGSVNRTNAGLKAALNHAADRDERIERKPWDKALKRLDEGGGGVRNVILPKRDVLGIIESTHQHSAEFGLFCEVVAQTGARPVAQAGKLKVHDLKVGTAPKLMMPASKKGKGEKLIKSSPVPITLDLALRLQTHAKGKPEHALLLTMPGGAPWQKSCHARYFKEAVKRYNKKMPVAGEGAVTIYAFRHTAIVRELVDGVPTRVVAATHDTSVRMIEKHYSAYIADHTDELSRGALLDTGGTDTGNVVSINNR